MNRYQLLVAAILPLLLWYFVRDIFFHRTPLVLPVVCVVLFSAFALIRKNILGLYMIVSAMCLSGGLLSIGGGKNAIAFFSDLPLPLNLNLFELLSFGIVAILYASICLKKDIVLFEETKISYAIYIFSAAILLSWFYYAMLIGSFSGLYELRRFMIIPLVFVLMINLVKNEEQLKFIVKLFVICIGIKSILGLITVIVSHKFILLYSDWAESTFFLMAFFLYFSFKDYCPGDPIVKYIRIFSIPLVLCLLFSGRRTLWGSFAITICLYLLFMKKIGRIKFVGLIISIGILITLVIFISDNARLLEQINSMKNPLEANNFILRQWEWKNAWEYIKMKPLLGHGLGSILPPVVDFKHIFRTEFTSMLFHNNYLWIWAKMGLFVLIPFLLIIFLSIKNTYKLFFELEDPYYKSVLLGILLSLMAFTIAGFVSPTMVDLKINVWLGFVLGIVALIGRFNRSNAYQR